MLPYHLRIPAFASNEFRAQKEQQGESADVILSGGGPIQRAMEQDLMELRPKFLEQVENITPPNPQQHLSAGDVFKCFRHVFGQAKIALVHTRTVPPRCDRGAYAQLLYSACLSLLEQAFETSQDLEHAAYAVFCLYALYETNPLPLEPATPLQLLPMGLQDPDNPKHLFRRSFKLPIRIDRHHYSLLQRLRDESLARQSDCQCKRMKAWKSRVDDRNHTETIIEEWTCSCGTFIDIVEIVDRLMPNLDLSEYTGPVGLEGLAGHADYPYEWAKPNQRTSRNNDTVFQVPESVIDEFTDEELDALASEERTNMPLDRLEEDIARYKSGLKEIHFPPANAAATNQAMRIRDALKPVFEHKNASTGDNMGGTERQEDSNDSLNATGVSANGVGPTLPAEEDVIADTSVRQEKATDDTIEEPSTANALTDLNLVFPTDLSESQRDGIRTALNNAVAMGDILFEHKAEVSNEKGVQDDDESVASSKSTALADDDSPGQGAVALRNLLSAVSMPLNGQPVEAFATQGEESRPSVGLFGSNFLTANSDLYGEDYPESSSESSDDSFASADIGGMSLQALWSTVDDEGDGEEKRRKRKRKKKRKRRRSPARKGTRGKAKSRKLEPPRTEKRVKMSQNILSESSEESEMSIDVGRTSLQLLLSAVHEGNDEEPVQSEEEPSGNKPSRALPKGKSSTSQKSKTPRSKVRNKDRGRAVSVMSSEDSDESVDVGRTSLRLLLSAVHEGNYEEPVQSEEETSGNKRTRALPKGKSRMKTAGPQQSKTPQSKAQNENGGNTLSIMSSEDSDESVDVGCASLRTLLSAVEEGNGEQSCHDERRERGSPDKPVAQNGLRDIHRSHSSAEGPRRAGSYEVNLSSDSQRQYGSSDEDSIQSVEQQGKAALSALLSLVSKDKDV